MAKCKLNKFTSEAELRRLYVDEGLTGWEIADMLGVHGQTIYNWLRRVGIEVQGSGKFERTQEQKDALRIELSPDLLKALYWDRGWSMKQIGNALGVGTNTVKRRMIEHDIRRRTFSENLKLNWARGVFDDKGPNNSRRGWYTRSNGGRAYYHSSWELKRFKQLDAEGVQWEEHPSIRIPYKHEGEYHIYIPDILLIKSRKVIVEEIKPLWRVQQLDKTQAKLRAAKEYCERRGWQFVLRVGEDLREKEVINAKRD